MRERAGARAAPAGRDASRPVYVISVAAELVSVHPRTLRIYEGEGLVCPARTPTNIRLYSENDLRRILWIRHLTQNLGVNLAGVRVLFELEERLGMRILEQLYSERRRRPRPRRRGRRTTDRRAAQVGARRRPLTNPDQTKETDGQPKPRKTAKAAAQGRRACR